MSWSLASLTAAMIDAAITSVDANRSVIRFCSSIAFLRSCSSRAIARLIRPTDHLTTSDPLRHDLMGKLSLKNLCWQIAALLAAERTRRNDPVIRQRLHRRRNVLVTPFAGDHKRIQAGSRDVKHGYSIGEYKAKISTGFIRPFIRGRRRRAQVGNIKFSEVLECFPCNEDSEAPRRDRL